MFKSPAVGDVTGDALPEIVGSNSAGQAFVWRANGTLLPGWPLTFGNRASAPVIADINNNGTNEIVLGGWADGMVRVLSSTGAALPGWPVSIAASSLGLSPPVVGDLDNDGQKEIVVATRYRRPISTC